MRRICAKAATSPAPQFYITPKQALEQYRLYKRDGSLDTNDPITRQMYLDIFSRYDALAESGSCDFKYSIMMDVLDSPAPSFYINPSAAHAYYYRAMKERRKMNRNRKKK